MALIVVVLASATGAVYSVPTVELGVLPSVVYRIEAPPVVVLIVIGDVYVPAGGLNVGAATTGRPLVENSTRRAIVCAPCNMCS